MKIKGKGKYRIIPKVDQNLLEDTVSSLESQKLLEEQQKEDL